MGKISREYPIWPKIWNYYGATEAIYERKGEGDLKNDNYYREGIKYSEQNSNQVWLVAKNDFSMNGDSK